MNNNRIHAAAFPLLALILLILSQQAFSAPEPNAVLEASAEGLISLALEFRSREGKELARYQFKATEGLVVGGVAIPGDGADYDVTAFGADGIATYSGKGSIPALQEGDGPLDLPLPATDQDKDGGEGIVATLSRERLVLEAKALDEPDSFSVHLQAFDPRGNPLNLDPNDIQWSLTDPTYFEIVPLDDPFDVVIRPREGTSLKPSAEFCDVPPKVVVCIAGSSCRNISVCRDPWVAISAGHSHTCALKKSGAAYCWGDDSAGQLGGSSIQTCGGRLGGKCATRPLGVKCPALAPCRFTQISAGNMITVAIDTKGDGWSWGRGLHAANTMVAVSDGFKRITFKQISAGDGHACGVSVAGDVWCWGYNRSGQAGAPMPLIHVPHGTAFRVLAPMKFTKVVAGGQHTCALGTSGTDVICWGRDDRNETSGPNSSSTTVGGREFFTQHFGGLTPILDVVASDGASCVNLGNIHGVACWGINSSLNFGSLRTPPEHLSAGSGYLCAIFAQQPLCLGANRWGQLGIHSLANQPSPVAPNPPPALYSTISTGTAHTCGLTTGGVAYCWGGNWKGEVGNGRSGFSVWEPEMVMAP